MAYSSASEGEIVDDKATRSRPSNRDSAVDRRNRPRSPLSRSNRPHSPSSASRRPRSPPSRSTNYARGEKRRHHYDRYNDREPPEKRPRSDGIHKEATAARQEDQKQQSQKQQKQQQQQQQQQRKQQEQEQAEEVIVDEATLIEERRKRREALRAKHRLLGESAQPSPSTSHVSSPMSLANDNDIVPSPSVNDGPSAADYDATMDTDAPAVEYDETKEKDRKVVVPAAAPKELDMFADDDEDDMFAPEPAVGHKKEDGTQAVRIPEAKQLDRSLLDDWDDPEGYYRIILGELLDARYHIQTNLGKGVFSAVVRALDTKSDRVVAIKIIRTQESMYRAGLKEIEILQTIAEADPDDKKHMIRLERHFEHKGHLCMVFENLSENLREVLKKFGRDIGINIRAVRSYAQQMFLGLSLLKKCEILHADLKPDNVLVNESRTQLKIADLGSAMYANDNEITDVLVSRFYRAPEIMLGIRHDYAIDMWSIGCTLFELYTGKICFTGSTNNQMLKGIMECRGKIPNRMLKRSEFWAQHFDPDGTFLSHEVDNATRREVVRRINITRTVPSKELKPRLLANAKGLNPEDAKELNLFADLLDKCLAVDPTRRITPTDALKHPFIHRIVPHPAK